MSDDMETRLDRALRREDRKRRGQCMHHNARGKRCRLTCHESSGIACKRHLPEMRLALASDLVEIARMMKEAK